MKIVSNLIFEAVIRVAEREEGESDKVLQMQRQKVQNAFKVKKKKKGEARRIRINKSDKFDKKN